MTFSGDVPTAWIGAIPRQAGALHTAMRNHAKPADAPSHEGGRGSPLTMFEFMPSPSHARWKRALDSVLRLARLEKVESADEAEDVLYLRGLCSSLVEDLPQEPRCALDIRILRARDRRDLWNLRSHLFGAISLQFGEHVARERLQRLDAHWH